VRTTISLLALIAALVAPAVAQTSTTASSPATVKPVQMADGTYTAIVEKVLDTKRVVVKLSSGAEATLTTARENVDFSKCQTNQQIRFSVINGLVAVYAPVSP
jgi:ABC-type Fe3+-hydroxamate transport system substrate-binding protein